MLAETDTKKLEKVFSGYPEIEAVYLFGSAATKKKKYIGDLDLGIVESAPSILEKKIDLYADLVKQGFDDVDLIFFNSVDLVLQFEIIHHNKLLYRKEGFEHSELFSKTIRKYFDFEPYLERQREKLKERILHG